MVATTAVLLGLNLFILILVGLWLTLIICSAMLAARWDRSWIWCMLTIFWAPSILWLMCLGPNRKHQREIDDADRFANYHEPQ